MQRRLARLDWQDGAIDRARARWARISSTTRASMARRPDRPAGPASAAAAAGRDPRVPAGAQRADRLPWLLGYYRGMGVDRFLVLDNDSDDGTRDWLLAQGPDVHLFHTPASFAASGAGMRWINRLLDEHGSGAWCLTIDADEVLVYPHCETHRCRA